MSPARSATRIGIMWCIATSSRRTFSFLTAARSSVISGSPRRWPPPALLPWAIAAVGVATAIGFGVLLARRPGLTNMRVVAAITAPPGQELLGAHNAAFSPDGRRIAFVASDAQGRASIWLRALD